MSFIHNSQLYTCDNSLIMCYEKKKKAKWALGACAILNSVTKWQMTQELTNKYI